MNMDQVTWSRMMPAQKDTARNNSGLTKQLVGLEGWRVEVTDDGGNKWRFIVGKSTGWRPCHLEVKTRRSKGGVSACDHYAKVEKLYKAR
jgi:hypothetical protein